MPLIEAEEAARRLARAIASDLSLYNEEKIIRGIESDTLFDVLEEEIAEGQALYNSRVSPDLYTRKLYERALVDILVRSSAHSKCDVVAPDNKTAAGETSASGHFIVSEAQAGSRVDKGLAEWLGPPTSRAAVQRWIEEKRVTIDDNPARAKDTLRIGQVVAFVRGEAPSSKAEADASVVFDVIWEDDALLVVNKPAGLVVHPARGHQTGTLVNGLVARPGFGRPGADARDVQGALRPGIVHRIDKDTSGLLVVAKTEAAREGLKAQFARHSIERQYWAATVGLPTRRSVETHYGRHPTNRLKFTSMLNAGRKAVTHIQVVERLDGASIVHCRLETGRTHQIRVHLSEQANAPLLGDKLYGKSTLPEALRQRVADLPRQALHAFVLGFVHPITGEHLRFEAPLPTDLVELLSRLRAP